MMAPGPPPTQGPPPRTPRSPPRTPIIRRPRTLPTRSLHACNDGATLSIKATATLKIRIHLPCR